MFGEISKRMNVSNIGSDLAVQGWSVVGTLNSSDFLAQTKAEIDELAKLPGTEVNYMGTEHRIWKAHEKLKFADHFRLFSNSLLQAITSSKLEAFDVLAIRNRQLDSDALKTVDGRWHLDSISRQLKTFVFLTDVTENSGAFEMIPGSQRWSFKFRQLVRGELVSPSDILSGARQYSSLSEDFVERIIGKEYQSIRCVVPAGTILAVDTSCIHRASPCIAGDRYAITSYYN